MSTASYADIYKEYLDNGFGAKSEVWPTGTYRVRIALIKPSQAQGKKFQTGVRLIALPGDPYEGKSTWVNQTLTMPAGDDKSKTAFMMYLKFMQALGVPDSVIKAGVSPDKLHEHIVIGTEGTAQLRGDRMWGNPPKPSQDLVAFEITATPSALGGMLPVGGAAAPAQAPVAITVAAPVPVAVPVAVAVPAAAPAGPTVEQLQAQLAALTAAQPAALPPVPGGPSF